MKIHFIGIGGASLSKLALIYKSMGFDVSGSDRTKTYTTEELERLGVILFYAHKKQNVWGAELIVYSDAINKQNPELIEANKLHIPVIDRKTALNNIAKLYKNVIAVCGCHGKTTTSALLVNALKKTYPQSHIGGELTSGLNENYYNSVVKATQNQNFFVSEACEFKRNLLGLNPNYIIMLNIGADHLDCYKDIDDIENTFLTFAQKLKSNSKNVLFYNADDERVTRVAKNAECRAVSFGINCPATYTATDIKLLPNGISFNFCKKGKKIKTLTCHLFGKHNVLNVLAVASVCDYFKENKIAKVNYSAQIKKFVGVKRRFERLSDFNGNVLIHDYAHHPTEIEASILAAREHFKRPAVVAFEPHTYTRTQALWNEFRTSLSKADKAYLLKIYSAREKRITGITSAKLAEGLKNTEYVKSYDELINKLSAIKNSTILILGAGSIETVAHKLVNNN